MSYFNPTQGSILSAEVLAVFDAAAAATIDSKAYTFGVPIAHLGKGSTTWPEASTAFYEHLLAELTTAKIAELSGNASKKAVRKTLKALKPRVQVLANDHAGTTDHFALVPYTSIFALNLIADSDKSADGFPLVFAFHLFIYFHVLMCLKVFSFINPSFLVDRQQELESIVTFYARTPVKGVSNPKKLGVEDPIQEKKSLHMVRYFLRFASKLNQIAF
jgi:hypothetical protein